MKAVRMISVGCRLLISLVVLAISVPTNAADFFPLDVWEEMVDWQSNRVIDHEPITEGILQPSAIGTIATNGSDLAFPFDVAKALNDLEGADGRFAGGRTFTLNRPFNRHRNPYWLPEECFLPGGPLMASESRND